MEHDYKAGDWVQIVNVDEIVGGEKYWKNGDVCLVVRKNEEEEEECHLLVATANRKKEYFIGISELHAIQPVELDRVMELSTIDTVLTREIEEFAKELERLGAIDRALDTGDRELFMQLTKELTT